MADSINVQPLTKREWKQEHELLKNCDMHYAKLKFSLTAYRVHKEAKDRLKNVIETEIKMSNRVVKKEVTNAAILLGNMIEVE